MKKAKNNIYPEKVEETKRKQFTQVNKRNGGLPVGIWKRFRSGLGIFSC